jgi:hypothetical protein
MKHLTFLINGSSPEAIEEIEWKNPRVINDFWFGDSGENSRPRADVFPDTPRAREAMQQVIAAYDLARQAMEQAAKARFELANMKVRGELE